MLNALTHCRIRYALYRTLLAIALVAGGASFSHAEQLGAGADHHGNNSAAHDHAHSSLDAETGHQSAGHHSDSGKTGGEHSSSFDQDSVHCGGLFLFSSVDLRDTFRPARSLPTAQVIDTFVAVDLALELPPPRA